MRRSRKPILLGMLTARERKLLRRGLNPFVLYKVNVHPPLTVRFKVIRKVKKK